MNCRYFSQRSTISQPIFERMDNYEELPSWKNIRRRCAAGVALALSATLALAIAPAANAAVEVTSAAELRAASPDTKQLAQAHELGALLEAIDAIPESVLQQGAGDPTVARGSVVCGEQARDNHWFIDRCSRSKLLGMLRSRGNGGGFDRVPPRKDPQDQEAHECTGRRGRSHQGHLGRFLLIRKDASLGWSRRCARR